ncbi:MAG: BMP family ABC transporter substrate-binding protein [Clostridiaceae bacterium]|jgi:basic membrane lipoprotein Med (substrate-binding protein (PBP1-ABC) superfamily)|nr:BMP family ABC transporter substrate-binding protein [Clostridiaceae bacterium]
MQNSKNNIVSQAGNKHIRWSVFLLLFLMVFSMLTFSACDDNKKPGQTDTKTTTNALPPGRLEPGERDHVAFILGSSITSDYGKNAYQGLQLISAANAESRYVENVTVSAAYDIAEKLIKAGYNVIFFDSPVFDEIASDIAKKNPDIMFFVVDGSSTRDNLVNIAFRDEEQNFLLGAVAALLTPEDSIGLIAKYPEVSETVLTEAFEAGAKYVNPAAVVRSFVLDPEQNDASIQTEQLIDRYNPSILAVIAGSASESAMSAARKSGLKIVSAESGIKLLSPVTEATEPEETATDDETVTTSTTVPVPTTTTTVAWSPGATRSTINENDPNLYDPASIKVLLKQAEAYLYAYELFRSGDLPADTIYCGVKEGLITVEDYASDIGEDQIASIENVMDIIAEGDVSIPR